MANLLPVSTRIPADAKAQLVNEASKLGMKLSEYVALKLCNIDHKPTAPAPVEKATAPKTSTKEKQLRAEITKLKAEINKLESLKNPVPEKGSYKSKFLNIRGFAEQVEKKFFGGTRSSAKKDQYRRLKADYKFPVVGFNDSK